MLSLQDYVSLLPWRYPWVSLWPGVDMGFACHCRWKCFFKCQCFSSPSASGGENPLTILWGTRIYLPTLRSNYIPTQNTSLRGYTKASCSYKIWEGGKGRLFTRQFIKYWVNLITLTHGLVLANTPHALLAPSRGLGLSVVPILYELTSREIRCTPWVSVTRPRSSTRPKTLLVCT